MSHSCRQEHLASHKPEQSPSLIVSHVLAGKSIWMHHLCLSRVEIDSTPPTLPNTSLGCASCVAGTGQPSPLGPLEYAAPSSDGTLEVSLTSFDDAASAILHRVTCTRVPFSAVHCTS